MTEKMTSDSQASPKIERFEFKLTVNDNIICQRYFRINGFKRESYGSIEIVEAMDKCVALIDKDLKEKTSIYLENAAPMMFETEEDMYKWGSRHKTQNIGVPIFVALHDGSKVFTYWEGEFTPYEKNIDLSDFVERDNEVPCVLKLSFLDDGREIISKTWDGNMYSRFVRTNIDLSNSRNKYKLNGIFAPFESAMLDKFIASQPDLIPQIVRELCIVCSKAEASDYTSEIKFGNTTYDLNIRRANHRIYRQLENKYRKKTAEYFRGI